MCLVNCMEEQEVGERVKRHLFVHIYTCMSCVLYILWSVIYCIATDHKMLHNSNIQYASKKTLLVRSV